MQESQYAFLKGGGEMGERMRAFDWEKTSVGAPGSWPAALRVTVSILLNSKFPMFLLWGDDYIQFYNDAYRPSFGTDGKHPAALGQRGRECWQEAWSVLGPLLEQVRLGGEAVWKEDQPVPIFRNGSIENTFWTFSYSPVLDDQGKVGGVLSTCFETTEKVVNYARLNESKDELGFAIEAAELGTWDLNPVTGRFAANSRLKEWFGLRPDEEIPLSLAIDAVAPGDRQRVSEAINKALDHSSGGEYEVVYSIINPITKRTRTVSGKGRAWFGEDKKAYRFNGTLQDITEQKLAELAQKESEARLKNVANNAPTGLWLSDREGGITYLNKTLVEWTDMPYRDLLGAGWANAIIEEDRQRAVEVFLKAVATHSHYEVEFRLRKADGSAVWCRAEGDPFYDDNGDYAGYAGYCMDIQQLKTINETIEDNRRQLLSSFEAAPVAIATIDKHQLTFTMANHFYGELVDRRPEDIINKPLLEVLPEIADQGFDKLLEQVIDTGIPFSSKEISVDIRRGGKLETIYVDLVYQPQYNSGKLITGVLVVATDVTEQVSSRRVIEESEAKFRSLIMEAPVATSLFVGPDMKVELANDRMLGYWGKDKRILGLPLAEALPELKGQPFLDILARIFVTGQTHSDKEAEAKLVVDGKLGTYYFNYTYKPLRNTSGEVYAIMNMAIDVTDQVISQRKLEESERFTRHIFYNSPVAKLVYIGENMVLRDANEAMLKIFGRDESILNKPIMESIPEFRETDLLQKYQRVITTGEAHYEYAQRILLVKNGQNHWGYYDYIYKPLRDSQDKIYGVVCTAVDVTKEVTSRQEIEAAEASLRNAIELAELATWKIDVVNKQIEYSDRLQEWLGIKNAGLEVKASPRIHPQDRERVGLAMQEAMRPGGKGHFDETYKILHTITGHVRIIHSSGRTTFDEQGNPLYITGTAQDVTLQQEMQTALELEVQERTEELAASNEELEATNEELRRSNEELSQYAYVASHDLQEPLRKIRVFSGMLNDLEGLPPISQSYLKKINGSAERMSLLIKDLLELSRLLNSDKLKRPVDLDVVLTDVKNDFELLIAEKHAVIKAEPLPTIDAIGLQMNQLFYNLISNALKFVKQGAQPVINIRCRILPAEEVREHLRRFAASKAYYEISFSDNGIGFDERFADQIFEVFKRLHGRDLYAGSGIGLSLCRRIVSNHGGYLYAESQVDKGSVFYVVIPEK